MLFLVECMSSVLLFAYFTHFFKVPITPKILFRFVKSLHGIRKMPQKCLQLIKTRIFYEFLKIVKSALFQNTAEQQNRLKKSGYSASCDVIPGL